MRGISSTPPDWLFALLTWHVDSEAIPNSSIASVGGCKKAPEREPKNKYLSTYDHHLLNMDQFTQAISSKYSLPAPSNYISHFIIIYRINVIMMGLWCQSVSSCRGSHFGRKCLPWDKHRPWVDIFHFHFIVSSEGSSSRQEHSPNET